MPDTKMPPRVDDPDYWRFRAENARKQADEMKDTNARNIVLNVAEQYDRLARIAEERRREASPPTNKVQ